MAAIVTPMDPDRYIREVAASHMLFDAAERASWRVPKPAAPAPPRDNEGMWLGSLLGFAIGVGILLFFNSSGITGLAIGEPKVEYVAFDFSVPEGIYLTGAPIEFQILPPDARASIAYIRSDGGIVMLEEPRFIPQQPGTYIFNALLTVKGLTERRTLTVDVIQNPLRAAEQRVAEIAAQQTQAADTSAAAENTQAS